MKKILTIAGSDSCGGAGIQADLKAITLLGEYGLSVVTALTAQNTQGVQGVQPVSVDFIEQQWNSVVSDISVDAVKTGMLWNSDIIALVARKIKKSRIPIRIFDPVMIAKSGAPLLQKEAIRAFVEKLLPIATVVTPNIPEARLLSQCAIRSFGDMENAAKVIHRHGAQAVVIKGGHRRGAARDILFDGKRFHHFSAPRIDTEHTHGTGCTFASALACMMTRCESLPEAVENAKAFITAAISNAVPIGQGQGPTNPYALVGKDAERYRAVQAVKNAFCALQRHKIGHLIPEVQSNIGFAVPLAKSFDDVIAFPGRIVRLGDSIATVSGPEPGASQHVASIILTLMAFDPKYRSAMNIRYEPEILQKVRKQPWMIKHFDRTKEPRRVKIKEGSSLEWGVGSVLEKCSRIPDVIYDAGDVAKEPMIRVFGKTPQEVVNKVLCLR